MSDLNGAPHGARGQGVKTPCPIDAPLRSARMGRGMQGVRPLPCPIDAPLDQLALDLIYSSQDLLTRSERLLKRARKLLRDLQWIDDLCTPRRIRDAFQKRGE